MKGTVLKSNSTTQSTTTATVSMDSIYARSRQIKSLGLTVGLNSHSSAGRLKLGLLQESDDEELNGDDSDPTAVLSTRTASRLTRDRPWKATNTNLTQAIQQTQQRIRPTTAAVSRTQINTINNATTRQPPPPRTSATGLQTPQPTSTTVTSHSRPTTATSGSRLHQALANSIETLKSSQYLPTNEIARLAIGSPLNRKSAPESSTNRPARPQSSYVTRSTDSTSSTPTSMTTVGYAQPTSSSSHYHATKLSAPPVRSTSAVGNRRATYEASFNSLHSPTHSRLTTPTNSSSIANQQLPQSQHLPPPPPCVIRSYLRITPPNPHARALIQHKELSVLHHSPQIVQFVDEELPVSSKTTRYNPHLQPLPPEPPLFQFDQVYPARPKNGMLAQQDDLWNQQIKPLLLHVLGSNAEEEACGMFIEPKSAVIVSTGLRGSGKSVSLFGLSSSSQSEPSPTASSISLGAGLIERTLHYCSFLSVTMPKSCQITLGISAYVLLVPSTAVSSTSSSKQQHLAIDLLASEWDRNHSYHPPSAPPPWKEVNLTCVTSDTGIEECSGALTEEYTNPQTAFSLLMKVRQRWLASSSATALMTGAFVVNIHLLRRQKLSQSPFPSITRSTIRFLEPPGCLREWSLKEMSLAPASMNGTSLQDPAFKELDDLHQLLQLRAFFYQQKNQQDPSLPTPPQSRISCHQSASTFSRLLLTGLNPNGIFVTLTHVSQRGLHAVGGRVIRMILEKLGHVETSRSNEQEDGNLNTTGSSSTSLTSPINSTTTPSTSLICQRFSSSTFLVTHLYPMIQLHLPKFYAPLLDIIMDYLGAGAKLSVRLKKQQGQSNFK